MMICYSSRSGYPHSQTGVKRGELSDVRFDCGRKYFALKGLKIPDQVGNDKETTRVLNSL